MRRAGFVILWVLFYIFVIMISIVRLWETIMQTAKKGTAGYQDEDEFNRDIAAVQTELMGVLAPWYAKSIAVKELLAPFVEPYSASTSSSGVLTKPADYFQITSASVGGYPATQIDVNEVHMLQFVPSRRPSSAENRYSYYLSEDEVKFLPAETLSAAIVYLRQPAEASIALTPTSTADSDYLTPTSVDDLEWPERAFNLIYYMMLMRLGIEAKESLLAEFASMGLKSETIKIQ